MEPTMRPNEIRMIPLPELSMLQGNDATALALAYQQTKCVLLREICAQLAEQTTALRELIAKDWVNAATSLKANGGELPNCNAPGCCNKAEYISHTSAWCRQHWMNTGKI